MATVVLVLICSHNDVRLFPSYLSPHVSLYPFFLSMVFGTAVISRTNATLSKTFVVKRTKFFTQTYWLEQKLFPTRHGWISESDELRF